MRDLYNEIIIVFLWLAIWEISQVIITYFKIAQYHKTIFYIMMFLITSYLYDDNHKKLIKKKRPKGQGT
jgi:hypothetical protein